MIRYCLVAALLVPLVARADDPPKKPSRAPVVLTEQALKIHADMPVIELRGAGQRVSVADHIANV